MSRLNHTPANVKTPTSSAGTEGEVRPAPVVLSLNRKGPVARARQFGLVLFLASIPFSFVLGAVATRHFVRDYRAALPSVLYRIDRSPVAGIEISDCHGQVYYRQRLNSARHIPVDVAPDWFTDRVLAAEDRRFYRHLGVDPRGIARAVVANVTSREIQQGGSTVTQQLVKLLLDTPERTVYAKLLEALLAVSLERHVDKGTILQAYLNHVYLGQSCYGFETAARWYFGQSLSDVSEEQAQALVDALPNPGTLGRFAGDAAGTQVNPDGDGQGRLLIAGNLNAAPYPAAMVLQHLRQRLGSEFGRGYVRVSTTIDLAVQRTAQRALTDYLRSVQLKNVYRQAPLLLNGAVVVLHADSGNPAAVIGGEQYSPEDQFNRALATRRPIGSTTKPFLYAASIERFRYTADTAFTDRAIEIEDDLRDAYSPENHYWGHKGEVTLQEALARSINTVALQLSIRLGVEETQAAIERFLLDPPPLKRTYGLALGAAELSPWELATAYMAFVDDGNIGEPEIVQSIHDDRGEILLSSPAQSTVNAIPEKIADRMRQMMKAVFAYGGTAYRPDARYRFPIAGKTGSHGANSWFVGFSPLYLTTVWIGVDKTTFWWPAGLHYNAHSTFHTIMESIHPHDYVGGQAEWF